jgi:uncharacterized protein (DUF2147 family)
VKLSWKFPISFAASLAALAWAGMALADSHAETAEGVWLTAHGGARIRISPCARQADQLCGAIVWLKDPVDEQGEPARDTHNPNPELRSRKILGLELIRGLKPSGPGRWSGGRIYNANNGKSYRSHIQVTRQDKLRVGGCVLMFCGGETWTRVSQRVPIGNNPST